MRLFIAANLSEEFKDLLSTKTAILKTQINDNLRWVKRDNYHITLNFLGETVPELVPGIKKTILEITNNWQQIPLSFKGVAAFPHLDAPRTIFIALDQGIVELNRLQQNLAVQLLDLGFDYGLQPYRPHLTIARCSRNSKTNVVASKLKSLTDLDFFDLKTEINKISLIKSELSPKGPIYQEIYLARLLPFT